MLADGLNGAPPSTTESPRVPNQFIQASITFCCSAGESGIPLPPVYASTNFAIVSLLDCRVRLLPLYDVRVTPDSTTDLFEPAPRRRPSVSTPRQARPRIPRPTIGGAAR